MKFFYENYSQEIPICIKCLREKYNLKQSNPKKLDFLGSLHTSLSWQPFFNPHPWYQYLPESVHLSISDILQSFFDVAS